MTQKIREVIFKNIISCMSCSIGFALFRRPSDGKIEYLDLRDKSPNRFSFPKQPRRVFQQTSPLSSDTPTYQVSYPEQELESDPYHIQRKKATTAVKLPCDTEIDSAPNTELPAPQLCEDFPFNNQQSSQESIEYLFFTDFDDGADDIYSFVD